MLERVLGINLAALEDTAQTDLDVAGREGVESEEDMRRRALFGLAGGMVLSGTARALDSVRQQLDATLTGPVAEDDAVE